MAKLLEHTMVYLKPAPWIIDDLVNRIVETVNPLRVFRSAARDEMDPDRDLELLVIVPDGVHRR